MRHSLSKLGLSQNFSCLSQQGIKRHACREEGYKPGALPALPLDGEEVDNQPDLAE